MNDSEHEKWGNWFVWSRVCYEQVKQAVTSRKESDCSNNPISKGKLWFAVVSTAFFVEAYTKVFMDFHFPKEESNKEIYKAFQKLSIPHRLLLLPRFVGSPKEQLEKWEEDNIHKIIETIFQERNNFAHAKLGKKYESLTPKKVTSYWNATLDIIYKLETEYMSRVPHSRHSEFKSEVDALRI